MEAVKRQQVKPQGRLHQKVNNTISGNVILQRQQVKPPDRLHQEKQYTFTVNLRYENETKIAEDEFTLIAYEAFDVLTNSKGNEETINFDGENIVEEDGEQKIKKTVSLKLNSILRISVTRNKSDLPIILFIDNITVIQQSNGLTRAFPVGMYISKMHHSTTHCMTCLPAKDPCLGIRKQKLEDAKKEYQLEECNGLPMKIKHLPENEFFSKHYQDMVINFKAAMYHKDVDRISKSLKEQWHSFKDLDKLFKLHFKKPRGATDWQKDNHFGQQRMNHCNSSVIRLCKHIPGKLNCSAKMLERFLEKSTLDQVMEDNRLFICDLKIVRGLLPVCPIVLLYQNTDGALVPIAIQLTQKDENDAVFLPGDENFKYTWMSAKMWYNLADASVHQSIVHLGFTHLIMEGFAIVTHRQLSVHHPVFQLLAPHFKYLLAINQFGRERLLGPSGYIQQTMAIGSKGAEALIRRKLKNWRLDLDGTIEADLKERGLLGETVLPNFHYRNDAIRIYNAIKDYVKSYLEIYYEKDVTGKQTNDESEGERNQEAPVSGQKEKENIINDNEIKSWGEEIVKSRNEKGLGIQGVPNNGNLTELNHLIDTVTPIIYTCSAAHAAANFPQYDEYAFVPNYPGYLKGVPPEDKEIPLEEGDILKCLPDKEKALGIMALTKLLSDKATNSLGNFPVVYNHDEEAKTELKKFQTALDNIKKQIADRNNELTRKHKCEYKWLSPDNIPNSIAI